MKSRNFLVTLLSITAMLFLSLSAVTSTQAQSANLSLAKTSTITGSVITSLITVTNNGPDTATNVVITDPLPAGTTFNFVALFTVFPTGLNLTRPPFGTNGTVTGSLATLPNGGTATLQVESNVAPGTPVGTGITNTATVVSATTDPVPANNTASATVTTTVFVAAVADLAVRKTSTIFGNTITNTITVTNNSTTTTANNVVVTDVLPAETFFLSAFGGGFVAANSGQTVTGTLASLAPGASATFTVISQVNLSTEPGTVVTNTATVTSSATDLFTANNTATTNVLVGLAPVPNGFAPAFSGRAIGAAADANLNGGLINTTAFVGIGDTGPLPSTGGRLTGGISAAGSLTVGGVSGALTVGGFNTLTAGGALGTPDTNVSTSLSRAAVNNLNVTVGGVNITAATLTSNTNCACGQVCNGTSAITGLTVGGTAINIVDISGNATATAQPNTTITLNLLGGGTVTVILNEQIIGNGSITVNALRVVVTVGGVVTSNVVVAQAHSDIACNLNRPTAAGVSIAGRVLSPSGRGISRARVLLTNSTGQTRSVMTNPFGYYSFSNVEAGSTYIFEVRDKRYTFTPQTISLTEGVTNFNFKAQQ